MERILEIGAEHGIHLLGAPPESLARSSMSSGAAGGRDGTTTSNKSMLSGRTRGETNPPEASATESDDQALRKLVAALEKAWNAGDSLEWTAQFAPDADFIHILGGHFCGESSIERGHRAIFDTIYKGSTNRYTVQKIRFLAPQIALVFVLAELKLTQPGLPQVIQARPTLIAQKLGSSWKIMAFQNTMVTSGENAARNEAFSEAIHSALSHTLAQLHPVKGHAGQPVVDEVEVFEP
jgi:uncharacterized protein (TIGR02246 family)